MTLNDIHKSVISIAHVAYMGKYDQKNPDRFTLSLGFMGEFSIDPVYATAELRDIDHDRIGKAVEERERVPVVRDVYAGPLTSGYAQPMPSLHQSTIFHDSTDGDKSS